MVDSFQSLQVTLPNLKSTVTINVDSSFAIQALQEVDFSIKTFESNVDLFISLSSSLLMLMDRRRRYPLERRLLKSSECPRPIKEGGCQ